ncbi:MAG: ATP-binding protein [Dehalococcoidia bacterium]|nr:ATP-binding protein [Dehalococcoidia bacterium]
MDFESRKIIEALRSGIPSRVIGGYFGSARTELLAGLSEWLDSNTGGGKILTASYGEGKTHLLNTVFRVAQGKNMAVSMISLSRDIPFSNLAQIYQRISQNTYLPKREQSGFDSLLEKLEPGKMAELQLFTAKDLQTDKLYYLLKAYCNTDDPEVKFSLLADLQGDFIGNTQLKKIYKGIFAERVTFSANFVKSRHTWDYVLFLGRLFELSGLHGWVILFDEAEHIGRLGRKARFGAYVNMSKFLNSSKHNLFSLFTMTSNYAKQVIEEKDERGHLSEAESPDYVLIEDVLTRIETAPELKPLDRFEFREILSKIIEFHALAYNWKPNTNAEELCERAWSCGYYLRTKIRAAIECLDQLFQYGDVGIIAAGELEQETYLEAIPLPDELEA